MGRVPKSTRAWTVGRRLFLLVLLPLSVLVGALGVVANGRWSERQAAADVVVSVENLRTLVALQSAVYNERAAVELETRSAAFGVPASLSADLLNVPQAKATFEATEAAIVAASATDRVLPMVEDARRAYSANDPLVIDVYNGIDELLLRQIVVELDAMQGIAVGATDAELITALEHLEEAVVAFSASTNQTTGLADTWFGGAEDTDGSLSRLGFLTARYEIAVEAIDSDRLPEVVRTGIGDRSDPVSTAILGLLAGALETPEANNIDVLPAIVGVFEASFTRNGALGELVATSADEVEQTAARIADDAADAFLATLLLGGAAVTASMLLSWRLAASIAGPMSSVAARTRELQAGTIEARPLALTGPRELRDVASAINDASVNLEALEGKLDALARADLGDDRLTIPLPGRMGEALTQSVNTLLDSIADRRDLQARLRHQANHDALTGLANRAAVLDHLSASLERAAEAPVGLLFVDLDEFKRTNDVFGHGAGDEVLVEVAGRLRGACRPHDMVARLGGDEFLIVAERTNDLPELITLAERIVEVVGAPMPLQSAGSLSIAPSIGVARADDPMVTALDFLSHADAALRLAKSTDGRIGVFDADLRERIQRRATIEQDLHTALSTQQFEVHYQPVLRSDSNEVGQLEALVRWVGQSRYGPDDFIPVAEQSDLVIDIDRFVLGTATKHLASMLHDERHKDLCVAVNLSGRHLLHADVVAHVTEALDDSQLDPSRLIIEVTETALIVDLDRAAGHLTALRSMGVRVSVDDFGTGFTSISQLRRLPVDELKIDRSLISELPGDQALIRVVRDLAVHFGMTTVAEGVETEEQAEFLRNLGPTQLQGWLYARAMPAAELTAWFAAQSEFRPLDRVGTTDLP